MWPFRKREEPAQPDVHDEILEALAPWLNKHRRA